MLHRRIAVVGSLIMLFLLVIIGIASCGITPSDLAETDLQNSVNLAAENGLGSGNWDPPTPANRNQCTQMYDTMESFRIDINGVVSTYDEGFIRCFDENGELLEGADRAACFANLTDLTDRIKDDYIDFQSGFSSYTISCNQKFENSPRLESPIIPKVDPLTTEGIEPPETWYNGWLTCIQGVHNPEYAFFNLDVEFLTPDGQS
ncbi:MAG: hypothetical protein AAF490_25605 [Chloroflexota bacterium]